MVATLPSVGWLPCPNGGADRKGKEGQNMTTIREHNRARWDGLRRKADYIVGVTLDGGFLCAECVGNTPAESVPGPYGPNPVFSSDDYSGMTCESCLTEAN